MAKVGEGDDRWIVAERADGKNVGNWHWSEFNLLPFFKNTLPERTENVVIVDGPTGKATITKIDKIEGDFNAMNRKGKTIFVWDINLTVKWKGVLPSGGEVLGTVDVTDIFNDETGPYQCSVKLEKDKDNTSESIKLKDSIRKQLSAVLQPTVLAVIELAKEQITIQSPVEVKRVLSGSASVPVKKPTETTTTTNSTTTTSTVRETKGTKTLKQVVVFDVPPPPLFETFTDERRIGAFTQGPATMVPKAGGSFSMFGGSVCGEVVSIETNKKIVKKWRFSSWDAGVFSNVTLDFEEQAGGKTQLSLTQTGIPEADFDRTKSGWEEFFWKRIRGLFGWSYKLK